MKKVLKLMNFLKSDFGKVAFFEMVWIFILIIGLNFLVYCNFPVRWTEEVFFTVAILLAMIMSIWLAFLSPRWTVILGVIILLYLLFFVLLYILPEGWSGVWNMERDTFSMDGAYVKGTLKGHLIQFCFWGGSLIMQLSALLIRKLCIMLNQIKK